MTEDEACRVLGVSSTASLAEIKRARNRLAKELKPKADREDRAADDKLKDVNAAFELLEAAASNRTEAKHQREPERPRTEQSQHQREPERPRTEQGQHRRDRRPGGYAVGDPVFHETIYSGQHRSGFGDGSVADVRDVSDGEIVTVEFARYGTREIFGAFVGMNRVV